MDKLKKLKVGASAFALAVATPVYAFAATPLADSMGTKVTEIIEEVQASGLLILGIVGALVVIKVVINLFKRA